MVGGRAAVENPCNRAGDPGFRERTGHADVTRACPACIARRCAPGPPAGGSPCGWSPGRPRSSWRAAGSRRTARSGRSTTRTAGPEKSEAVTVARVFARSLSARDLRDPARLTARQARLIGVHPDLTTVAIEPAGDTHEARYVRQAERAELSFPLVDARGRRPCRAAARLPARRARQRHGRGPPRGAARRRRRGRAAAADRDPRAHPPHARAPGRAARGRRVRARRRQVPAPGAGGWRRNDAVGVLAGALDALGGTSGAPDQGQGSWR